MPVSSKSNGLSALGKSNNTKGRDELAICGKHSAWSYHGFYRSLDINEKEHLVARLGIGVSDNMKLARMKA
jgi:hypothetical protein